MRLRVYDWNQCDPNEDHTVRIEDMDAGIGYMLRCMQELINQLQKAIENKISLKGTPKFKVSDWFDKDEFQHKRLYDIINQYIDLGTDFESEAKNLDRLRELRNYYVHDFPYNYLEDNSILVPKFRELRKFIRSIARVKNSVINSINKSARAIKVKENLQKEADKKKKTIDSKGSSNNKIFSRVRNILMSNGFKRNQLYPLSLVGNVLSEHNIDYGPSLKRYLESNGFELETKNGKVWSIKI